MTALKCCPPKTASQFEELAIVHSIDNLVLTQTHSHPINIQLLIQMVEVSADVAGQLLTKQYRREKIFGYGKDMNPFRAPGSVCFSHMLHPNCRAMPYNRFTSIAHRVHFHAMNAPSFVSHNIDEHVRNVCMMQCFDHTIPSPVRAGAHKLFNAKEELPEWSRATCEFRCVPLCILRPKLLDCRMTFEFHWM